MSWAYGQSSSSKRDTCDPKLIRVMDRGLELSPVDITIVWGWRDEETQNSFFDMEVSKKRWPDSKHNFTIEGVGPSSQAFDFGPWVEGGIPWDDTHLFALIAGVFFAAAEDLNIKLRWGGDWDMDGLTTDQTFMDWGHMETAEE